MEECRFVVYPGNNPEAIREALLRFSGMREIPHNVPKDKLLEEADVIWRPVGYAKKSFSSLAKASKARDVPIVYNHIEGLKQITTKTGLIHALKEFYESNPLSAEHEYTLFDSTPTTFIIDDAELPGNYLSLLQRYKEISQGIFRRERVPEKHCRRNMWIVKPADLNQGRVKSNCRPRHKPLQEPEADQAVHCRPSW